jgi:hypothetical protein
VLPIRNTERHVSLETNLIAAIIPTACAQRIRRSGIE